jgi:hypothetical protein
VTEPGLSVASPKELELLRIMADYSEPQTAAVLARIVRYRGGGSTSVVHARLGTLHRKGFVGTEPRHGAPWWITDLGRAEARC